MIELHQTSTFVYPAYLRYILPASVPTLLFTSLVYMLSYGWTSSNLTWALFCALVSSLWLRVFRRYRLKIELGKGGIRFLDRRRTRSLRWNELETVRFSGSGVEIRGAGKNWRVTDDLSGWPRFEQEVREHASSLALASWLTPPFRVRTRWMGLLQPAAFCLALFIGGSREWAGGHWKAGIALLGAGAFFLVLFRNTVLWYGFARNELTIRKIFGRERHPWHNLTFATVVDNALTLSFTNGISMRIDANQITRSAQEIFLSMQEFWAQQVPLDSTEGESEKLDWSWRIAVFWWMVVPALVLLTFPVVISGVRAKLGPWASHCDSVPTPEGPCRTLHHVGILLRLDIALLVCMAAVIAIIHWSAGYCDRHRDRLLVIFIPTLLCVVPVTIAIMAAQSTLLAALLYYVPMEFARVRFSGLLITVGVGLLLGLFQVLRNGWKAARPAPIEVDAISVLRSEQPRIWNLAIEIASAAGAPQPDNILLGLEPNFFVTESPVKVSGVRYEGCSLYLSIPAIRTISENELRAVLGHEFSHFREAHTIFAKRFFPLYNSAVQSVIGMTTAPGSWTLLPAIYMLQFFLVSFGKPHAALSRDREFVADQAGANAASAIDLASSLVKLELFGEFISKLVQERIYTDRCTTTLGQEIKCTWPSEPPKSLLGTRSPHPFDSHPPLGARLSHLNVTLESILSMPMTQGGIDLLEDPDSLEARLLDQIRTKVDSSTIARRLTYMPRIPHPSGHHPA